MIMPQGNLGEAITERTNIIEAKNFSHDQNYRHGMLYDWNMNPLEEVDFKFEKNKTYSAQGRNVEYMIHFMPNYNPEFKFKDKFYKKDGRERLGFYIDVKDISKNLFEKWLIVGKDDRSAMDRYNAFKCNWCLEWMDNNEYHKAVCVMRDSSSITENSTKPKNNDLGGRYIYGEMNILLPSSELSQTIHLGSRLMVSDDLKNLQVFEVIKIKDTVPLGITALYLEQVLFNAHTDYCGILPGDLSCFKFNDKPEDLPDGFGGQYHYICSCLNTRVEEVVQPEPKEFLLKCEATKLYINGQFATVMALCNDENAVPEWHIFIDNEEYQIDELKDDFIIEADKDKLNIKCINLDLAKYIVKIAVYDANKTYYNFVEMEVVR